MSGNGNRDLEGDSTRLINWEFVQGEAEEAQG
jgi:hypothetical protein